MNIKWHGLTSFTIKTKNVKIMIDPALSDLKISKENPDIIINSKEVDIEKGEYKIFSWPGEYESKDVLLKIIPMKQDAIIIFEADDLRCCHLGNIKEIPSDEIIEKIGDIDILFVPIGNKGQTIGYKEAIDIIEEIEPKCVIPMNFTKDGTLSDSDAFLKEVGIVGQTALKEYPVKTLPVDKTEYVLLEAVN